ncbi:nicotinate-nucleotide--dimethylbenzimidazole phosphoribosyltransferase [Hyphomicrobium sp. D-2]|uniref:nicotinate-nucleotide--dimethylbenzimidazole phosphoribosyltransferase n=1 Tax=Hyphomicrobium sp. D-2 TaxID=3041621 RepID=UPI00245865F9|nr:nicotinate-nucleotide--dimethylbenzimidazole phosphoribosyltransferase [Hyphomicrobium sp. D-2]MDH4981917.1 nicotinate-nucleotide--dimethylbenzimidazole phosphoribosyltransferase [Hyphomicrobium sp. D-2]
MGASWIRTTCPKPSEDHRAAAEQRQGQLTKPPGSLGALELLAVRLASLQATERPSGQRAPIILFAGDHGVTAQGVSAYPSDVTVQMLHNFANGGAAVSVLARELNVPLTVVDVGTLGEADIAGVISDKPRRGTRDFSREAAMTDAELAFAFDAGKRAVQGATAAGADLVILGEMGIGNTTSAAAIATAFLACRAQDVVGAGTGLDNDGIRHKAQVIDASLSLHGLDRGEASPIEVLRCVGGLEITALAGAMIAAAQRRIPVLVDGFIVTVAALAACRINPDCVPWLIYSHRSAERGHRLVLDALAAEPILDLKLRLGEGSGAGLALPVLRLACALHNQMATFEEASVSGPVP